jgi:hypothetical protein
MTKHITYKRARKKSICVSRHPEGSLTIMLSLSIYLLSLYLTTCCTPSIYLSLSVSLLSLYLTNLSLVVYKSMYCTIYSLIYICKTASHHPGVSPSFLYLSLYLTIQECPLHFSICLSVYNLSLSFTLQGRPLHFST